MQISINGEQRELTEPMTIGALLNELGLDGQRVAVELNRCILKRKEFNKVTVSNGDRLEIVHFVGGG